MIPRGLQVDQAPPISVPFRFFVTAPLFLLAAAAVLVWRGPEVFASRLTPAALAVTHLFTLGFMTMVMVGALMQLLPVVAGAPIPRPRAVGALTHAGLALGTFALAGGFLFGQPPLLKAAALLLPATFAVFIVAVALALVRVRVRHLTLRSIWLAVGALLVTVTIGAVLAGSLAWGVGLADESLRALHPGWGLLGWVGLLAVGVAWQVVPMFQITPAYPAPMPRLFSTAMFGLLVLWSIASWGGGRPALTAGLSAVALAGYAAFAGVTLGLQRRRRRRLPDVTLDFWRTGMLGVMAVGALWIVRVALGGQSPDAVDVLIGVVALAGVAGSIVNGMLYKIMPFLAWFHLQAITGAGRAVPNVKQVLGESPQRWHLRAHLIALALLAGAAVWHAYLPYAAGLAVAVAAALLWRNQWTVIRAYRDFLASGAAATRPAAPV